jgi:DNA-directed RNA polymerase subunit RPC12/RpoP
MNVPKPKKYSAEIEFDISIECTSCGAAIHENLLVSVSKDAVRCPYCGAIFEPKKTDVR